jgi:hypothetical protein
VQFDICETPVRGLTEQPRFRRRRPTSPNVFENGKVPSRRSELRQQADYGYGELDEDVDTPLSGTRQFVSEMETLCTTSG